MKQFCKRGHERTEANVDPNDGSCRICRKARNRKVDLDFKTCALEGCDVVFETDHRRIYCCKEHGVIANRLNNNRSKKEYKQTNPEEFRRKIKLQYTRSARLEGKLIDCECPICGRAHQQRNVIEYKHKPTPHFCDSCRRVAESDYSDGFGQKYDSRTDRIEDFT